jgi:hypothetical protein
VDALTGYLRIVLAQDHPAAGGLVDENNIETNTTSQFCQPDRPGLARLAQRETMALP